MFDNKDCNEKLLKYDNGTSERINKINTWLIAIGLQKVDNLTVSSFLLKLVKANIKGKYDLEEVKNKLDKYYRLNQDKTKEYADKVTLRIVEILDDDTFSLDISELLYIHDKLFKGLLPCADSFRDYNITKREWVLNGKSVTYSDYIDIEKKLNQILQKEKTFSYDGLSEDEIINHLSKFISSIWQVHPFLEGNTRTTAVFLMKYLDSKGFKLDSRIFIENTRFFRNALVRACYSNDGIKIQDTFLKRFIKNLLNNEDYRLKNRYTSVNYSEFISLGKTKKIS